MKPFGLKLPGWSHTNAILFLIKVPIITFRFVTLSFPVSRKGGPKQKREMYALLPGKICSPPMACGLGHT
jgi:hypothetical protein